MALGGPPKAPKLASKSASDPSRAPLDPQHLSGKPPGGLREASGRPLGGLQEASGSSPGALPPEALWHPSGLDLGLIGKSSLGQLGSSQNAKRSDAFRPSPGTDTPANGYGQG